MKDFRKLEEKYFLATYAKRGELMLVRGEGSYVFDDKGKKYLDFTTSLGIASLGHSHPRIAKVLFEQASTIMACNTSYYSPERAELCQRLAGYFERAGGGESQVSLLNSGAEANEAALKFARGVTGRKGIVYAKNAFHGRTMGALSACGTKQYQEPAEPLLSHFYMVPYGDFSAMEEMFVLQAGELAAVILEPIQGESGVIEAPLEYFLKLRKLCDEHGVLLIFDEVQTGSGRTGEFFCFEHFIGENGETCVPDMVCLAKAIGTGFPISATIVKKHLADKIPPKFHGSTYGAGPLASRVGLEVLNIFEEEEILNNVTEMGEYFKSELKKLAAENDKIRDVRGRGLILAIELKERVVGYLRQLQEEENLLVLACGSLTIRFLPPFNVTKEEIDEALAKVKKVLA